MKNKKIILFLLFVFLFLTVFTNIFSQSLEQPQQTKFFGPIVVYVSRGNKELEATTKNYTVANIQEFLYQHKIKSYYAEKASSYLNAIVIAKEKEADYLLEVTGTLLEEAKSATGYGSTIKSELKFYPRQKEEVLFRAEGVSTSENSLSTMISHAYAFSMASQEALKLIIENIVQTVTKGQVVQTGTE